MFNIHSLSGRITGQRAEALRQVSRVQAPARLKGVQGPDETPPESDTTQVLLHTANESRAALTDQDAHGHSHPALVAYTQIQQDAAQHPAPAPLLHRVVHWMNTPVISVQEEQTIDEALAVLHAGSVAQAPVLNAAGQLVGLLLQRDAPAAGEEATVRHWMRSPVPSVDPDTDLRQLAAALLTSGLPGLPVTDAQGAVLGFIARGDLLRAMVAEPPLDLWG